MYHFTEFQKKIERFIGQNVERIEVLREESRSYLRDVHGIKMDTNKVYVHFIDANYRTGVATIRDNFSKVINVSYRGMDDQDRTYVLPLAAVFNTAGPVREYLSSAEQMCQIQTPPPGFEPGDP